MKRENEKNIYKNRITTITFDVVDFLRSFWFRLSYRSRRLRYDSRK